MLTMTLLLVTWLESIVCNNRWSQQSLSRKVLETRAWVCSRSKTWCTRLRPMRLRTVAGLLVRTKSFSLFLRKKAVFFEKVKVTEGRLRISSCAQIYTKMVRLRSNQSQRGEVLRVQSERGTGQEPIHTIRHLRLRWQIVRQSHLLLTRKLRWKERSVSRRKLLSSDWFAFRKNKRKSSSNRKKQK